MDLLQELRFAARSLLKNRSWTAIAVVALALGIGANVAIFSVVGLMIWIPLPYPHPEELAYVMQSNAQKGFRTASASLPEVRDWAAASSISSIAPYQSRPMALTGEGEPQQIAAMQVAPEFFPTLGVGAAMGRVFLPAEGPETEARTAVISHELWQGMFRGQPDALGRDIRLDGRNYAIVGVMPKGFHFVYRPADVWVPLSLAVKQRERGVRTVKAVARLKPGVSAETAAAELRAISERAEKLDPADGIGWRAVVFPREMFLGIGARAAAKSMFGAMVFVLLIACANVASLLLARGSHRQRELALRASLGAGRGALIRLQLIESVLLSLLGGAVGLVSAIWTVPILKQVAPPEMTIFEQAHVDWAAAAFGFVISLVTGVAFGIAPAWMATRGDLASALQQGNRGSTAGGYLPLKAMVVTEMALAMLLVAASALMIRSVIRQTTVDPGFDKTNLASGLTLLPQARYPDEARTADFYRRVLETLGRDGRVESAAAVNTMPLGGSDSYTAVAFDGDAQAQRERSAGDMIVSPGYFRTLRIGLAAGRDFRDSDTAASQRVAIVNQKFVEVFWPNRPDVVGSRVRIGGPDSPWSTVVGVARDVRHSNPLTPPRPEVYRPHSQAAARGMSVVTRGRGTDTAAAIRAAVYEADREQPIFRMQSVEDQLSQQNSGGLATTKVLGGLAGIALILAAVGTYGVMACLTARRIREIGIRLALGASREGIFGNMLRSGLNLALLGLAIGLPAAYGVAPLLRAVDPGVDGTHAGSYVWVAAVLAAVAVAACAGPAWKAMRTDPAVVLRNE